jgi:hypothetical protein
LEVAVVVLKMLAELFHQAVQAVAVMVLRQYLPALPVLAVLTQAQVVVE